MPETTQLAIRVVQGWHADDKGSLLQPPAYQKLEGDWTNGEDPAKKA